VTPLHRAMEGGHLGAMSALLDAGAEAAARDQARATLPATPRLRIRP
jgi:ankyrin repeat protein